MGKAGFRRGGRIASSDGGFVLVVVLTFVVLMASTTVFFATVLKQDIELITRAKFTEQAKNAAEAGINHALARLKSEGFSAQSAFTGALDTGTYSVTFHQTGGRYLVRSAGTVKGVSRTVSVEIENLFPSALNYLTGAGNDIKINAFLANSNVTGDIHANGNVYLRSGPIFSNMNVTGDVSATGVVKEGSRLHNSDLLDARVYINGVGSDNGTVYEGTDRIDFPVFDYGLYQQEAVYSGSYYAGDKTFQDAALAPSSGITYVEGRATFRGACTVAGGIVADEIYIWGTFAQSKFGSKNVIISRSGDIKVWGQLSTDEALVYAKRDINSAQAGAGIVVNGIILAERDIDVWNFLTRINYTYVLTYPDDIGGGASGQLFSVVSWNS